MLQPKPSRKVQQMAKKPLAGKRWFYAAGARAKATGVNTVPKAIGSRLPLWAQSAFSRGWFHEHYAIERATQAAKEGEQP